MRNLFTRGRLWLLTAASGGGLLALEGCNPDVRDYVLTGVGSAANSLATTFITAFFQGLVTGASDDATVVRAVLENVQQFLC
jgi:hypothetical protein